MTTKRPTPHFIPLLALGASSFLTIGLLSSVLRAVPTATTTMVKPAKLPTTTMGAPQGKEIATLAAGCFWSMEAIYENLKGVESVEPGYAGGNVIQPKYEQVGAGGTGHAEAVHIVYDPKVISYRDLLQILLIMRDPTTLNRQGPDQGPNYRSVIFTHNASQKEIATQAIREITAAKVWQAPIVTPVTDFSNFYQAEDYHRDYYRRHPEYAYNRGVIAPKLKELKKKFPDHVRS
jgi:peptide-methionine (S)-S-oxide reductase